MDNTRIGKLIAPWGSTDISVNFFIKYQHSFGDVRKAEVNDKVNGSLVLTNESGDEMHLHQCTSGYGGTGPSGTKRILIKAGFDETEVEHLVSAKETFNITK